VPVIFMTRWIWAFHFPLSSPNTRAQSGSPGNSPSCASTAPMTRCTGAMLWHVPQNLGDAVALSAATPAAISTTRATARKMTIPFQCSLVPGLP